MVATQCMHHTPQILSRGQDWVAEGVPIYDVSKGMFSTGAIMFLTFAVPAVHLGMLQVTFECVDALRSLIKRKGES